MEASWCHVIKVENKFIEDYTLIYIDTLSSFVIKTVNLGPTLQNTTIFSDFRSVDGIVIPFVSEDVLLPDSVHSIERVDSVEFNISVDESIFDPPPTD